MNRMATSPSGVDLIKRFEGLELEAYRDIAGIWTIAYGHTSTALTRVMDALHRGEAPRPLWLDFVAEIDANTKALTVTAEEAELLLRRDLKVREDALNGWLVMTGVDLNENEYDALISFIYNVGFAAFKGSTAARWLREGKPREQVADALTWWNKATVNGKLREVLGLTRRRAAERNLFLTPPNWSAPPRALGVMTFSPLLPVATRQSNACASKECRPLSAWLPRF